MNSYNQHFINNLLFFLSRNAWLERESKYKGLRVFKHAQNDTTIVLAKEESSPDFNAHAENAIQTISLIEDKQPDDVIATISQIDKDLHRIKVPSPRMDSVPIELAEQIISSTKILFELSARKENKIAPKIIAGIEQKASETVDTYMQSCQFGHTWRGSFGFTIEAPLNLPSIGLFDNIEENFERRISKRIFNGIKIIKEGAKEKSVGYIVDNVQAGFDGKMCAQIVEISQKLTQPSLEYSTLWSPSIKIDDSIKNIESIVMDRKTFSYAEKAADQLLQGEGEIRCWFNGFPEGFRAHKEHLLGENEFGEHIIYVRGFSQETDSATLKMQLSLEDYLKALNAHENRKDVRIDCRVRKRQRGWEVLNIYEIKILE